MKKGTKSSLRPHRQGPAALAEVARSVADDLSRRHTQEGVLFCWTGTGVAIAANKVPGIRAALCADAETARGARLWNNANVLCLSLRLTSAAVALEILESLAGNGLSAQPRRRSLPARSARPGRARLPGRPSAPKTAVGRPRQSIF